MGKDILSKYPYHGESMQSTSMNPLEAYLNRTWRAQLSTVGAEGLPCTAKAGNVLLPSNTLKLSIRLPPTLDAVKAKEDFIKILESNPPYGAKVKVSIRY
jgi:hypothetical protein